MLPDLTNKIMTVIKAIKKKIVVPRFKEENGFYTTKERSHLMSKIKAKETKPRTNKNALIIIYLLPCLKQTFSLLL